MTSETGLNFDIQRRTSTEMHLFVLQRDVRIIPSNSILAQSAQSFGRINLKIDILPPEQILSISDKLVVHNPPVYHYDKNGVRTSDAEYYVDEHETPKGHIIYLSKLKPNSVTSKHHHPHPLREFYFLLHGEAFQGGEPMKPRSVINPFEDHQVTTREQPALLLIFMENGARVPKDQRHIMQQAH